MAQYNIWVGDSGVTINNVATGTPVFIPKPYLVSCPIGRFFFKDNGRTLFAFNQDEIVNINGTTPPGTIHEIIDILNGNTLSPATGTATIPVEITSENLIVDNTDPENVIYSFTADAIVGRRVYSIITGANAYNRIDAFTQSDPDGKGNTITSTLITFYEGQLLTLLVI